MNNINASADAEISAQGEQKRMDTKTPPQEAVLREWKNKFYGKERNGKKYVGKNFIVARAIIDTQSNSVCIELVEVWEYSDFTIHDFVETDLIWFLAVKEYAKLRKFVNEWNDWCKANNFYLYFSSEE